MSIVVDFMRGTEIWRTVDDLTHYDFIRDEKNFYQVKARVKDYKGSQDIVYVLKATKLAGLDDIE